MPCNQSDCYDRHSPGKAQIDDAGVKRARCRNCGLKLRRGVGTRTWIIADIIGTPSARDTPPAPDRARRPAEHPAR